MNEKIKKLVNDLGIIDQLSMLKYANKRYIISLRDVKENIKNTYDSLFIIALDVNSTRKSKLLIMYSESKNQVIITRLAKIQESQLNDVNCKWLVDCKYSLEYKLIEEIKL